MDNLHGRLILIKKKAFTTAKKSILRLVEYKFGGEML